MPIRSASRGDTDLFRGEPEKRSLIITACGFLA